MNNRCARNRMPAGLRLAAAVTPLVLMAVCLTGCSRLQSGQTAKGQSAALVKLMPSDYPVFRDWFGCDVNLKRALKMSLVYLNRIPAKRMLHFGPDSYTTDHVRRSLQLFFDFLDLKPDRAWLNRFIRQNYNVYMAVGSKVKGDILYTGYFEPELKGSLEKNVKYPVPLHGRPKDMVTADLGMFFDDLKGRRLVGRVENNRYLPYWDRGQINSRKEMLENAKPIAWVQSKVDRFFLQIQGSGRIYLDNGASINVHYDGANGHPYRSIGRLLIDQGKIAREKMSMQAIRDFLKKNPDQMDQILQYNKSYVFFKVEKDGPLGAINVPLTPGRSLATDRRLFPPAALCYVQTAIPAARGNGSVEGWLEYFGFAFNQDTGGTIRGAGRADFFWGTGPYAEIAAGHMQERGKLYFLVLKP